MAIGALSALALASGFMVVSQERMMFLNVHDEHSRLFLQGKPGFYEIEFTARNGKTYHGMMYQATSEKAPLLIFFGGNGDCSYRNMRFNEERGLWGYFAGYHYLYIDYEGYGLNGGQASYQNMYEQALAVYDFAATLDNVDSSRIATMGFSIGTGSAVHLAAHRPVTGLILVSPFANGYDLYNNLLPVFFGPMRMLVRQKLPSEGFAPYVDSPALVIASRGDRVVPFRSSERLVKAFRHDVEFIALDHAGHNHIFKEEGVFERIQGFLETLK